MLFTPMRPVDETSVDPSALAAWQTLPHPFAMGVGAVAPGAMLMMPTPPTPPMIEDPYVS